MFDKATILHADLDAFYASVEQRDDPALRGRPVIVGGGVVLAASYQAKACGVRTAMSGRAAREVCPEAIVVEPRMSAYSQASKAVFEVFEQTTPIVEGLSIDEAFLDVSGLGKVSGTPVEIATQLRKDVLDQVGLAITVGVARTKFLAKVASGVAKPDGLLVVPPAGELDFLHPLPVERLWGVGPVTAEKLRDRGITTVGQVAQIDESALVVMLGRGSGRHLHALAHNRDPRPVQVGRRRRSMGAQRALGRKKRSMDDLDAMLIGLVDKLGRRLRTGSRVCRTVVLRMRFGDFARATRSHTLAEATAQTGAILLAARGLLSTAAPMIELRGLTLIGISLGNLDDDSAIQLALPFERPQVSALDLTIDSVRERFGSTALTPAVLLGRDPGVSVPLLPD
ncbi:DNA polymerase IV [Fodinicola feengrottensis]|uniref:DNA polymerase IV n=1 Tax=Fodinicola feengrottensis TaxID=435914 RepID=A0ABN2JC69_9ACTN